MESIIRTDKLTFFYPEREGEVSPVVIDALDLEIEEGSFTAILGHNGSGKSTLAKHFNGVLLPMGGRVYMCGMDTRDENLMLEIRRSCGLLFQNPDNQIVASVVEEDVAFGPENLGMTPEEIRQRVDEALKAVDMYDYRERAPHLLSGGQKQRIAIAGILAMRPRCIVLDEPTAMLDPGGRADVIRLIGELKTRYGITVVHITHHIDEVIGADRVIVMHRGKIAMDGNPAQVFTQVERLREIGLTVPDTTALLYELNKAGFDLPLDALTVDDCAAAIYRYLRG